MILFRREKHTSNLIFDFEFFITFVADIQKSVEFGSISRDFFGAGLSGF